MHNLACKKTNEVSRCQLGRGNLNPEISFWVDAVVALWVWFGLPRSLGFRTIGAWETRPWPPHKVESWHWSNLQIQKLQKVNSGLEKNLTGTGNLWVSCWAVLEKRVHPDELWVLMTNISEELEFGIRPIHVSVQKLNNSHRNLSWSLKQLTGTNKIFWGWRKTPSTPVCQDSDKPTLSSWSRITKCGEPVHNGSRHFNEEL